MNRTLITFNPRGLNPLKEYDIITSAWRSCSTGAVLDLICTIVSASIIDNPEHKEPMSAAYPYFYHISPLCSLSSHPVSTHTSQET